MVFFIPVYFSLYVAGPDEAANVIVFTIAAAVIAEGAAALRTAHQRLLGHSLFLEALLNHAGACNAVMKGRELHITLVNPAFQALRPDVPMLGRTYRDVFPEEAAAGAEALLRQVMDTGKTHSSLGADAPAPGRLDAAWDHQIVRLPADGEESSVVVISWDVTEHKRDKRQLRLLLEELNHRVKNTLAVVQSLAHHTFPPTKVPEEPRRSFFARLNALASAHTFLTRERSSGTTCRDVALNALSAYPQDRWSLEGPEVAVPAKTTVSLSLAFHELATNAGKYGALSGPRGHVRVSWELSISDGQQLLCLTWRELDGPVVREPTHRGFGTLMLERALALDTKGTARLSFPSTGVVCVIEVQVS